MTLKPGLGVT